jgi:hypothetical protein
MNCLQNHFGDYLMKLKFITAAALGLGVLAHGGVITTTLNVTISSSLATTDDYLLFYSNGVAAFYSLGSLPATTNLPGGVLSSSYVIPGNFSSGYVTAIGLASEADVAVAVGSGISGSTIASGWSSVFVTPESTVITDRATANTTALTTFLTTEFAHNNSDFMTYSGAPNSGSLAEFSNSVIGSLTVSSGVPEPSTSALLGSALGVLILAASLSTRTRKERP